MKIWFMSPLNSLYSSTRCDIKINIKKQKKENIREISILKTTHFSVNFDYSSVKFMNYCSYAAKM